MILTVSMAHPRKLIRQAVVALLTGATAAGARVYGTRVDPLKKTLPAISVYTLTEEIDQDATAGTAPRELVRNVQLEIVGFVAHTDAVSVDDAMDDLAEQIEAAMDVDPYLGVLAGDSMLLQTAMEVVEDNGRSDPLVGVVTLTYDVTFRTQPGAVTATDDFLRVGAKHRIVGAVDDIAAQDAFVVQESGGFDFGYSEGFFA